MRKVCAALLSFLRLHRGRKQDIHLFNTMALTDINDLRGSAVIREQCQ